MPRNAEEMLIADLGSQGPLVPFNKFWMEAKTLAFISNNRVFTVNWRATGLNMVRPTYYSWQFEPVIFPREDFFWFHPHPRLLGKLLLHLQRSRARGCLVCSVLPSKCVVCRVCAGR